MIGSAILAVAVFASPCVDDCKTKLQAANEALQKEMDGYKVPGVSGLPTEQALLRLADTVQRVTDTIRESEKEMTELLAQLKARSLPFPIGSPISPPFRPVDLEEMQGCRKDPRPEVQESYRAWDSRRKLVNLQREHACLVAYLGQIHAYLPALKVVLKSPAAPQEPSQNQAVVIIPNKDKWPLELDLHQFFVEGSRYPPVGNQKTSTAKETLGWYSTELPIRAGGILRFEDLPKGEWSISIRTDDCRKFKLAVVKWQETGFVTTVFNATQPEEIVCYPMPFWVHLNGTGCGCFGSGSDWGFVDHGCLGRVWTPLGFCDCLAAEAPFFGNFLPLPSGTAVPATPLESLPMPLRQSASESVAKPMKLINP